METLSSTFCYRTSSIHTSTRFNNELKLKTIDSSLLLNKAAMSEARAEFSLLLQRLLVKTTQTADTLQFIQNPDKSSPTVETSPLPEPSNKSTAKFCSILDSDTHKSVLKELKMDSVMNLIVGYVLATDIMVQRVALECNVTIVPNPKYSKSSRNLPNNLDPKIKVLKFSLADDALIEHNWKSLIEGLGLVEENAIIEVFENSSEEKDIGLKRNIIGYFLSQGMTNPRLATQVFDRAMVLKSAKTGEFSPEEDKIILTCVEEEGKKFAEVAKLLNRRNNSVWVRHKLLVASGKTTNTVDEDKLIMTEVFAVDKNILSDGRIRKEDWAQIGKKLQRNPQSVYQRWRSVLEPMLKKYHAGSLYMDEKEMLINHMVEHEMDHAQDVDWKELVKLPKFAGSSTAHLQSIYQMLKGQAKKKYPERTPKEPLTAKEIKKYLNNSTKRARKKNKEENIEKLIQFYLSLGDQPPVAQTVDRYHGKARQEASSDNHDTSTILKVEKKSI